MQASVLCRPLPAPGAQWKARRSQSCLVVLRSRWERHTLQKGWHVTALVKQNQGLEGIPGHPGITHRHKPRKGILLQVWRLEVQISGARPNKVPAGPCSLVSPTPCPRGCRGESAPCLFQLLVGTAFLGWWPHHGNLQSQCLLLSLCLPLIRTHVATLRADPNNPGHSLHIPSKPPPFFCHTR